MPSCSPSSSAAGVTHFLTFPALCTFAPSLTLPRFPKCQLIGHCHPLREPLPVWTLSLARVACHFDRGGKAVSVHKVGKREVGGGGCWDGGCRRVSRNATRTRGVLSRVYLYLFTDSVATAHTPSCLPPSASLSSETSHPPCWMNRRTPQQKDAPPRPPHPAPIDAPHSSLPLPRQYAPMGGNAIEAQGPLKQGCEVA